MPHDIAYYEFPWPDMTAPEQDVVLRSVQVMDYHVKNKGKVLVHCHAGLGRTGLMIACYYVYSRHIPSQEAIALVRETRPGAIQTKRQAQFVDDFEQHLWRLSQAFRVEISDALIDVNLFIQRQRLVLHGEKSDLYRYVPMFLHTVLCRLVQLTKDNLELSTRAMQYLGPSSAPGDATLSACRIAINRRRFKVQNVSDVSVLSFLVCDWFRSMAAPALSVEDCDEIVRYKRNYFGQQEQLLQEIRRIISKPVRHTIGLVISAFQTIGAVGVSETVKHFAFRCLVDSFNHAFNTVKLRHSPIEREFIHEFFFQDWAHSIGNMYFDYDKVAPAHRTIKRIALASSIILQSLEKAKPPPEAMVTESAASPRRWPVQRQSVLQPRVAPSSLTFFTAATTEHAMTPLTLTVHDPAKPQELSTKSLSSISDMTSSQHTPPWQMAGPRAKQKGQPRVSVAFTQPPLPTSLPSRSTSTD
ncbi:phosphatase [Strigomonas culicis]|uniref:Phosphatase n=1 Tax=Strigomonas culicis TaxID=28005 RepID=S9UT91_9TRYP|nr:phosphatase [Strigomonas culicis]|eukprot:EPY32034.1 phosphatase [Strigomonas culicis]